MIKLSIIGSNVKKTLSPLIYSFFLKKSNRSLFYKKYSCNPLNCYRVLMLLLSLNFIFINITIPYKNLLFLLCNFINSNCFSSFSLNFIILFNDTTFCYNTDGIGFLKNIIKKIKLYINKNFILIGLGGASRNIIERLKDINGKIYIYNRSFNKLKKILLKYKKFNNVFKLKFNKKINYKRYILINTIPKYAFNDVIKIFNFNYKKQIIFDINYKVKKYKKKLNYFDGIKMLYYQALFNYKIFLNYYEKK